MADPKATLKAQFKVLGSEQEVMALFDRLRLEGFLTAPDMVSIQFEVFDEVTAIAMRDQLARLLQESRAVVKDEAKTLTSLTFKTPVPKPVKRDIPEGQSTLFDEVYSQKDLKEVTAVAKNQPTDEERLVSLLRNAEPKDGMYPEELAEALDLSLSQVNTLLDVLFEQDRVEPEGNKWNLVTEE